MAASTISVKLRTARFDERCREQGWTTDTAIAEAMDLDTSTVSRARRGRANVGAAFIDATLRIFGTASYAEFFTRESS